MLSSIVFAFVYARSSYFSVAKGDLLVPSFAWSKRRVALEASLWVVVSLTCSAALWMIAPYVVAAINYCTPTVAAVLALSAPAQCSPASEEWYVAKRVVIGYLGATSVVAVALLVYLSVLGFRARVISADSESQ